MAELVVSRSGDGGVVWPVVMPGVRLDIGVQLAAERFRPKSEHHITLIGRATLAIIHHTDELHAALADLAPGLDPTSLVFEDQLYLLDHPKVTSEGPVPRQSLVVRGSSPQIEPFIQAVSERIGVELPQPLVHVTMYTRGDSTVARRGIGVDSQTEFDEYSRGIYVDEWQISA